MTNTKKSIRSLKAVSPSVAADKGIEFELKDPTTGEGLGMFWSVTGSQGSAYRAAARKLADAEIARNARLASGEKVKGRTVAELERDSIELLSACTTGWRNMVWDEGEGELEFTPDNVRKLLGEPFIRDQVNEVVTDTTRFTPG